MNNETSWKVEPSVMAQNTFNPIRAIVDGMKLKPNPEKPMIPLSIGDPTVFGNLPPPDSAVTGIQEAVVSGKFNGYAPSSGYQTSREAVARHLTKSGTTTAPEDVFLASGCSNALELAISVLVNPGENILIPRPGFSLYKTLCLSQGMEVKSYNCLPERMWEIDLNHLESLIDEKTRAIVVVNPSNPCGSNFPKNHVKNILAVASKHKIPLISDEIYAGMVFRPLEFTSCAALSDDVPILTCGGISKIFLVPGWRLGWVVMHDRNNVLGQKIRNALTCLTQRILGPCTLVQAILPKILEDSDNSYMDRAINIIQTNAEYAFSHIANMPGLQPVTPQAAFYMMVGISMKNFPEFKSEVEFTEALVSEQSVFCLPATCFDYPNYFRIVLTVPEEKLKEAMTRMEEFCKEHFVPCAA
ncbi:tyrosine aminotransferase-like [Styela clava]|uniref:tyrosine aminotransferase-like n=1 Tax=Styela clava TaxID=7725 RepID=UPI001939A3A5|nr:tyrosine aminotransferase-like [Styela clava]